MTLFARQKRDLSAEAYCVCVARFRCMPDAVEASYDEGYIMVNDAWNLNKNKLLFFAPFKLNITRTVCK